jgi:hypothetical protein
VKVSELRVGLFLWLTGSVYGDGWSCPAMVTQVKRSSFRVQLLDSFRIQEFSINGISDLSSETRIITADEVHAYLRARTEQIRSEVHEAESNFTKAKRRLSLYEHQIDLFIADKLLPPSA